MLCHIPETLRARKDPSAVSPCPGIIGRRLAPGTIINRTSINFVFKSTWFQKECQYGFEKWQGRHSDCDLHNFLERPQTKGRKKEHPDDKVAGCSFRITTR